MDGPGGHPQREISQTEEDKSYVISLTRGIAKIGTRRNKEQVGGCGGLGAGDGGPGHTLPVIGWTRSGDSHAQRGGHG